MGYVYIARNIKTDGAYVGMTTESLHKRMVRHFFCARTGVPGYFYNAIRLYGKDAFEWDVLFESDDHATLCEKEIEFSAKFGTYNICTGGSGAPGNVLSDEAKAKIGAANRGRKMPLTQRQHLSEIQKGKKRGPCPFETRNKIRQALAGRTHPGHKASEETLKRMSAAQKGRVVTDEQRQKIKKALTGKSLSLETKEKIRASHLGRKYKPMSDEGRRNLSIAHMGKKCGPMSETTKAKIGAANKGKVRAPISDETRAKRSASMRAAWDRKKALLRESTNA